MNTEKRNKTGRVAAVLFALAIWQLAAMTVNSRILLASPADVILRLTTIWQVQDFAASIWFSFRHIAAGFFLGASTAILLSALSAAFPIAETLLRPFLVTVKTVPVASFVVICLIWLSAGKLSVFISFLVVLPVIYNSILSGIKSEDVKMHEASRVFRLPPIKRLLYIHLPQLKPFIMSSFETALGMAWKAGIAAEIIGTPDGSIGKQLYYSKICLDTDDLLCWTVIIVAVSAIFEKLVMYALKAVYRRTECRTWR